MIDNWRDADFLSLPDPLKVAQLGYKLREMDNLIESSKNGLEQISSSIMKETAIALLDAVIDQRTMYELELESLVKQLINRK